MFKKTAILLLGADQNNSRLRRDDSNQQVYSHATNCCQKLANNQPWRSFLILQFATAWIWFRIQWNEIRWDALPIELDTPLRKNVQAVQGSFLMSCFTNIKRLLNGLRTADHDQLDAGFGAYTLQSWIKCHRSRYARMLCNNCYHGRRMDFFQGGRAVGEFPKIFSKGG